MQERTKTRELITYVNDEEWGGIKLREREDGLWEYSSWSAVQGERTGRCVLIRPPKDWNVEDEADMDTVVNDEGMTKADYLIAHGTEVRCLRRGHIVV